MVSPYITTKIITFLFNESIKCTVQEIYYISTNHLSEKIKYSYRRQLQVILVTSFARDRENKRRVNKLNIKTPVY